MKFYITISAVAAAIILAGIANNQAAPGDVSQSAAGFVAGIKGKGYILRNRDTIMISGMDLLYPGDSVQLAKGATARITICGGKGLEIRGSAGFVIRPRGIVFKRGKALKTYTINKNACIAALDVFKKNEKKLPDMVTGGQKGTVILRSKKKNQRLSVYVVRGRKTQGGIELYSDKVMPRKPFLAWTPVAGRASYRISISSGGSTLWSATVRKNRCEYPADAPPFAEGQVYETTVEALNDRGDVIARGGGRLSLFSREELESFRRDEASIKEMLSDSAPERHILLGKLYEANGQMDSALSSYEKALSLDGGNAGLKERITLLKNIMETEQE